MSITAHFPDPDKLAAKEICRRYDNSLKSIVETWNNKSDFSRTPALLSKHYFAIQKALCKLQCKKWLIIKDTDELIGADSTLCTVLLPMLTDIGLSKIGFVDPSREVTETCGQLLLKGKGYEVKVFSNRMEAQSWLTQ
jgi:hypothetical protein